jgi:MFS family permease
MVIGGPLCDILGMGRLLAIAFVGHAVGIFGTIFADGYWPLFLSTLAFGLANGFVEAACNPLIATLYPDQKIKRLNLFHVWFPGGIVIGGLTAYAIQQAGIGGEANGWKIQKASMLIPLVIYGIMFFGKKFPQTERAASGVSTGQMFAACLNPLFLLFVVCMLMTAATELTTTQWLPNILTVTAGVSGILFLVWINGLMAVGRAFAGNLVHGRSPIAILIGSAFFSAIGLYLLSTATGAATAAVAATIFAVGVCFFWPTMLGVVSERFPRTGALGLAIMGGAGMLSTSVFLPIVGKRYDEATAEAASRLGGSVDALKAAAAGSAEATQWLQAQASGGRAGLSLLVILPILLLVIFTAMYLYDKARGGYKQEHLIQDQNDAEQMAGGVPTVVR